MVEKSDLLSIKNKIPFEKESFKLGETKNNLKPSELQPGWAKYKMHKIDGEKSYIAI